MKKQDTKKAVLDRLVLTSIRGGAARISIHRSKPL